MRDMPPSLPPSAPAAALRSLKRAARKDMSAKLASVSSDVIQAESQIVTHRILSSRTYARAGSVSVYISMDTGEVDTTAIIQHALANGKRLYVPLWQTSSNPLPASPAPTPGTSAPSTSAASTPNPFANLSVPPVGVATGSVNSSGSVSPVPSPSPSVGTRTSQGGQRFASDMRMVRLTDWEDFTSLAVNRWGIREPGPLIPAKRAHLTKRDVQAAVEQAMTESGEMVEREDALDESTGGQGLDLILVPGLAFDYKGNRLGHGKGYYDRYIRKCETWAREHRHGSGPVTVALALRAQLLPEPELVPTDEWDQQPDAIVTADSTRVRRGAEEGGFAE